MSSYTLHTARQAVKVLQTNMGRDKAAMDLLNLTVQELEIQVTIVSEPKKNMVSQGGWLVDTNIDVALKVRVDIRAQRTGAGAGFVWADLEEFIICGCYYSANRELHDFDRYLDTLTNYIRANTGRKVIVCGDFNSKNTRWGSPETDARGKSMDEWLEEVSLEVVNRGGAPTFVRNNSHKNIIFKVLIGRRTPPNDIREKGAWRVEDTGLQRLARAIPRFFGDEGQRSCTAEEWRSLLTRACNATLPRKGNGAGRSRGAYIGGQQKSRNSAKIV